MKQPEDKSTFELELDAGTKARQPRTKKTKLPEGFKLEEGTLSSPAGSTWGLDPTGPARGRGRPPNGQFAMTAAERQKAYRERVKKEAYTARARQLDDTSTVAVIKILHTALVDLDLGKFTANNRTRAEQAIAELAKRYELDLQWIGE